MQLLKDNKNKGYAIYSAFKGHVFKTKYFAKCYNILIYVKITVTNKGVFLFIFVFESKYLYL